MQSAGTRSVLVAGAIGGFTPLVAGWLVHRTGYDYSPAFMVMAAAPISVVALLTSKETHRRMLRTTSAAAP